MSETPFLDSGTAPEYFATRVHRIDELGPNRRIVFAVERPLMDGSGTCSEPPCTVVIPAEALASLVRLACEGSPDRRETHSISTDRRLAS